MKCQGWLSAALVLLSAGSASQAQQAEPQAAPGSIPTVTTETRLVLVDTVVTDKKGNYIRDLSQKDFKVFEDGKEQPIKSFSSETGASSPTVNQKHYLVLFFDDSTMSVADQGFVPQGGLAVPGQQYRRRSLYRGGRFQRHAAGLAELHHRCRAPETGGTEREVLGSFTDSGGERHPPVARHGSELWRTHHAAGLARHGQELVWRSRTQDRGPAVFRLSLQSR